MSSTRAKRQRKTGPRLIKPQRHDEAICPGCVLAKLDHAVLLTRGYMNSIISGKDEDEWNKSNEVASAFCMEIMDFIGKRMEEGRPTLSPERVTMAALEAAHRFADAILEHELSMLETVH